MYKIYSSGISFIKNNENILSGGLVNAKILIDNSKLIHSFNRFNYLIKIYNEDSFIVISKAKNQPLYIFGNECLSKEAANVVADLNLEFSNVIGNKRIAGSFIIEYQKRMGGSIRLEGYINNDAITAEYIYESSNIKRLLLAGGCFWCLAKPYYEYDGVLKVLSGFAGGEEIDPSYENVKKQLTSHKEAIAIEYDSKKISVTELLDVYFDSIDPFDDEGQFIDRGKSYTCSIFSNDKEVIEYAKYRIMEAEQAFMQKCNVSLEDDTVFYKAEEYHQDYALKNPEAIKKEFLESGRNK